MMAAASNTTMVAQTVVAQPAKHWRVKMTEASRVQKMLNEQNEWIDRLKSQVMRLELGVVGYRTRNKQLEAALQEVANINNRRDRFSADIDAIIINALGMKNE
jgi:hypothetical protein